jgi:hypothetical protein
MSEVIDAIIRAAETNKWEKVSEIYDSRDFSVGMLECNCTILAQNKPGKGSSIPETMFQQSSLRLAS